MSGKLCGLVDHLDALKVAVTTAAFRLSTADTRTRHTHLPSLRTTIGLRIREQRDASVKDRRTRAAGDGVERADWLRLELPARHDPHAREHHRQQQEGPDLLE